MPRIIRPAWRLLLCLNFLAIAGRAVQLKITYLANEGVVLDCRGNKVLIDALLRDSQDTYARNSPQAQEQLETGKPPYDGVVLALATHFHLDHWDAGAISRFLKNNPSAIFASTPTATAMLPESQQKQVRVLWPKTGQRQQVQVGTISVEAFPLEHGSTQNLGYSIAVCDKKVVHLGDASVSSHDEARLLETPQPDIAMVPFWWFLDPEGAAFIANKWKPKQIVVLHFGSTDLDAAKQIQAKWPKAWVATTQGQSRTF